MEKITSILFATNNEHKLREVRQLFAPYHVLVLSLSEISLSSNPDEDGDNFADNAYIKANSLKNQTDLPIIADDSGLEIIALGGFPGVYSARFMENEPYQAKCQAIIEQLKPYSDKRAAFTCAIALSIPGELLHIFIGQCPGLILNELRGEHGFGYDPIFYSIELDKTFAEAREDEKNQVSHRGRAMKKLIHFLEENHYLSK